MKITKDYLRKLILEEISLSEQEGDQQFHEAVRDWKAEEGLNKQSYILGLLGYVKIKLEKDREKLERIYNSLDKNNPEEAGKIYAIIISLKSHIDSIEQIERILKETKN